MKIVIEQRLWFYSPSSPWFEDLFLSAKATFLFLDLLFWLLEAGAIFAIQCFKYFGVDTVETQKNQWSFDHPTLLIIDNFRSGIILWLHRFWFPFSDTSHVLFIQMLNLNMMLDRQLWMPELPDHQNHWSVFSVWKPSSSSNERLVSLIGFISWRSISSKHNLPYFHHSC